MKPLLKLVLVCNWLNQINLDHDQPMATCSPQSLLDQAACFDCLVSDAQKQLVILVMLKQIVTVVNPSADTSPQGLIDAGRCFDYLQQGQRESAQLQLLCELVG